MAGLFCMAAVLALSACGPAQDNAASARLQDLTSRTQETKNNVSESMQTDAQTTETIPSESGEQNMEQTLHLFINDTEVKAAWEKNEAVRALTDLVSSKALTVPMSMYGGFEQVGSLGAHLPANDSQIKTKAGDIVLYAGNQIVLFYGSNTWAYTRLGSIVDQTEADLTRLLGNGNVTITLSYKGETP